MLDIKKTIEVGEEFVSEELLGSERAWSRPIQIVEFEGRKFRIQYQATLIEYEYGPFENEPEIQLT